MRRIALVPISGKPVHKGHWGLIEIAAKENDVVHLYVSTSDRIRKGEIPIYGADMKKIWDTYLEPALPSNVIVEYGGSPVSNLYKELENAEEIESNDVYVIYSDVNDIKKYSDSILSKVAPTLSLNGQIKRRGISREETENISGTEMRVMLSSGNVKDFAKLLPEPIQKKSKEIIGILQRKSIRENLLRKYVKLISRQN